MTLKIQLVCAVHSSLYKQSFRNSVLVNTKFLVRNVIKCVENYNIYTDSFYRVWMSQRKVNSPCKIFSTIECLKPSLCAVKFCFWVSDLAWLNEKCDFERMFVLSLIQWTFVDCQLWYEASWKAGISTTALLTSWAGSFLVEVEAVSYMMFSSIPGAINIPPPFVTMKNVSRQCQISPGEQNHHPNWEALMIMWENRWESEVGVRGRKRVAVGMRNMNGFQRH